MATYPFNGKEETLASPARDAFAITPHATAALPSVTRYVYVGGTGTVVARLVGGTADVTFTAVPVGALLPIRASHIRATSTATALVGLV